MRSGKGRASSTPAAMLAAAQVNAKVRLVMSDKAPQNAEPQANAPSAHSVCMANARARTHSGTLVWVAVLKVAITAIQAAPPRPSAGYTSTLLGVRRHQHGAGKDDAAAHHQPFQAGTCAQFADHQASGDGAAAHAAHQQTDAGGTERELALAITGSSAHSAEPAAL